MKSVLLSLVAVLILATVNQTLGVICFILWWVYSSFTFGKSDSQRKRNYNIYTAPFKPDKKHFIIEDVEKNTKEKVEI